MRREFKKNLIPKPPSAPPEWLMSLAVPKELEIGAGDGEFALHRAKSQPDIHFIAIEKSRRLFCRMQNKYQKQNLPNLWIFHTNAVWWITHFVPKNSLNRIYILYPNTYIKARQKNLRWCNRPFMSYLLECLKTGGTLKICTNQQDYYEETKQKMALYPHIEQRQDLSLTLSTEARSKKKIASTAPPRVAGQPTVSHASHFFGTEARSKKKVASTAPPRIAEQPTVSHASHFFSTEARSKKKVASTAPPRVAEQPAVSHASHFFGTKARSKKKVASTAPPRVAEQPAVSHASHFFGTEARSKKKVASTAPPRVAGTAFERKYMARGETSWSLVYKKLYHTS